MDAFSSITSASILSPTIMTPMAITIMEELVCFLPYIVLN